MTYYVATINVPGYLPTDTEPPMFETATEAWEHLIEERNQAWLETDDGGPDFDPVMERMGARSQQEGQWGSEYASVTPGYDGDHDLGLAYTVTAQYGELCGRCDHIATTPEVLDQHMLDAHLEDDHR